MLCFRQPPGALMSGAGDPLLRPRRGFATAAGLLLALLAAAASWLATPWGLGLSPDSVAYLGGARRVLESGELASLSSHWPPGLPLLLAAAGKIFGLADGARLLQALFFALNAWWLARWSNRAVPHPAAAAVLAAGLSLQPVLLQPHLVLWTEPAFLFFVLADLWWLERACSRSPTRRDVAMLAALGAGALSMRYAGAWLVALNAVALVALAPPGERRRRLPPALAASLLGVLPLLAWLGWLDAHGAPAATRALDWHPLGTARFGEAGRTIAGWFSLPALAGPACLMSALLLLALAFRGDRRHRWRLLLALASLAYLSFLALSISLFDAYTPLDDRLLLPLFPLLAWLFASALPRHPWLPLLLLGLALALGAASGVQLWQQSRADGIGLSSRAWRTMAVWPVLAALPSGTPILSNGPELVEIHLGRHAQPLPRGTDPVTRRSNPRIGVEMEALAAHAGAIVHFEAMRFRTYYPPPAVIDRLPGFRRVYRGADAVVWLRQAPAGAPPVPPPQD